MNKTIRLVGKKRVSPNDIVLLKADANYTEVMLKGGEQVIVSKTLKEMEKAFTQFSSFFRTHKSFMVNLDHIEGVQLNGVKSEVRLIDNFNADISRRRKDAFLSILRQRTAVV